MMVIFVMYEESIQEKKKKHTEGNDSKFWHHASNQTCVIQWRTLKLSLSLKPNKKIKTTY